jgi:thiosulfate dehydrogenase [quinone] large subunit
MFVTIGMLGAGRVLGLDTLLERTNVGDTRTAKFLLG